MEKYIEAPPYCRVELITDGEFSVWSAREGNAHTLLGPANSQVRRTSFVVPEGSDGLVVAAPVETSVRIVSMINSDSRETPDQSGGFQGLDEVIGEGPEDIGSILRRELSRLGLLQLYGPPDADPNDDDDDFDVSDDESEPWATYTNPIDMIPDYPDEADPSLQSQQEAVREEITTAEVSTHQSEPSAAPAASQEVGVTAPASSDPP